jgi:hypothetical protein
MSINEAITKAIEIEPKLEEIKTIPEYNYWYFFISPIFWQALGKVLNWKEKQFYQYESTHSFLGEEMPEWEWRARRFFNYFILKGKSPEDYFNETN